MHFWGSCRAGEELPNQGGLVGLGGARQGTPEGRGEMGLGGGLGRGQLGSGGVEIGWEGRGGARWDLAGLRWVWPGGMGWDGVGWGEVKLGRAGKEWGGVQTGLGSFCPEMARSEERWGRLVPFSRRVGNEEGHGSGSWSMWSWGNIIWCVGGSLRGIGKFEISVKSDLGRRLYCGKHWGSFSFWAFIGASGSWKFSKTEHLDPLPLPRIWLPGRFRTLLGNQHLAVGKRIRRLRRRRVWTWHQGLTLLTGSFCFKLFKMNLCVHLLMNLLLSKEIWGHPLHVSNRSG